MKCVTCNSQDPGGIEWFTTWKGAAICEPCSQRGLGGDTGEIDRYAVDQLPDEVAPVHDWIRELRDTALGDWSEWTEEERARFAPGLDLAVELAEEELQQATAEAAVVREQIEAVSAQLLAEGVRAPRSPRDPEWEQVRIRTAVRATLRGWLNDLVTTAESTGLPTEQLPELLHEVLLARAAGENVVTLAPRKRRQR